MSSRQVTHFNEISSDASIARVYFDEVEEAGGAISSSLDVFAVKGGDEDYLL